MAFGDRAAAAVSDVSCSFGAFAVACAVVVVWALLGPRFRYSDTWQLVINTGTTIVTFLMAFLIAANQRKADEERGKLIELINANTLLTERHTLLIEQHTDAYDRHQQETHTIAQATHATVREMHEIASRLEALVTELHGSRGAFVCGVRPDAS